LSQAIRAGGEYPGKLHGVGVLERHNAVSSLATSTAKLHAWDDPKRVEGNAAILNLRFLAMGPVREVEADRSGDLKAEANVEEC